MPELLKPTLAERDKQAEQALVARYDALNQLFTQAEQILKALKPPHAVWIDYEHDASGPFDFWELLGLVKHQDKWRLCHAYDNEMNDEGYNDIKPIVECPVEVRIRAAKAVRALQERIVKAKEEYVPLVDQAIQELADLCNTAGSLKGVR